MRRATGRVAALRVVSRTAPRGAVHAEWRAAGRPNNGAEYSRLDPWSILGGYRSAT